MHFKKISVEASFLNYGLLDMYNLLSSGDLPIIFLVLISRLITLCSESMLCIVSIVLHLLRFYGPGYGLSGMFYGHLKKMCIVLLFSGVLYKCHFRFSRLVLLLRSVSRLIFCLVASSGFESRVLKSPTVSIDLSVSPFRSVRLIYIFCSSVWCIHV